MFFLLVTRTVQTVQTAPHSFSQFLQKNVHFEAKLLGLSVLFGMVHLLAPKRKGPVQLLRFHLEYVCVMKYPIKKQGAGNC